MKKVVLLGSLVFGLSVLALPQGNSQDKLPNIILIFTDDMGYGDLSCYGNQITRSPHIDRLAEEGIRFTDFYAGASLCTPSRAALLTGTYPVRNSMAVNYRGECVCFPVDEMGLHPDEVTLAEVLKQKDYKTALIGKWHLGDQAEFLPTRQGFDYYYGVPYSNDTGEGRFKWRGGNQSCDHPPIPCPTTPFPPAKLLWVSQKTACTEM